MDNKKGYVGVEDGANYLKRLYVGINDVARRIVKGYVGVDGVARLCYLLATKVKYVTSLTASFTEKVVPVGQPYGSFPITAEDNRVDFWFDPTATAKYDSQKKYVDYPWCAYADANATVYDSYGYAQDLLAKHWDTTGASKKLNLGVITEDTVCSKEIDHTLQHVSKPRKIPVIVADASQTSSQYFAQLLDSTSTSLKTWTGTDAEKSTSVNAYPGMKIKLFARYEEGLLGVGDDGSACLININGTQVMKKGTYTYTVPDDISNIYLNVSVDDHYDGGASYRVTLSTR